MTIRRVAGIGLDGSTNVATVGKTEIRLISADYADSIEPAFLSYMGSQEQDEQSPGSYKTEKWKIKMSQMVFRTVWMPLFPATGMGSILFPMVVGWRHPDLGDDSDLLENCRWTNPKAAVDNSNKVQEVELEGTVQQIKWTDARKTLNTIFGVPAPSNLQGI